MSKKHESRPERWSRLASTALDAVQELIDLKCEYEEWRDNLPENLESSALAEKLDAVIDLDLDNLDSELNEILEIDLPLGFGRD